MDESLDPSYEKEPIIPTISVDHHVDTHSDYFIVVPEVLKPIYEGFLKTVESKVVSSISVKFPELEDEDEIDEYDEQEQLYKSSNAFLAKQDSKTIEIRQFVAAGNAINVLLVPIFKNKLVYNLFASALFTHFAVSKLLCLGTSELNGSTINKLVSDNYEKFSESSLVSQVPTMRPPNFVTGATGALISQANTRQVPVAALVVSAEGAFQLDMEKYDLDSLSDLSHVLDDYLSLKGKYIKTVQDLSKAKRATSGSNALYI